MWGLGVISEMKKESDIMTNQKIAQKRRLKYMPVGEHITYTVKNKKLLFLNFSLRWLILEKMPWLAAKIFHIVINERVVDYSFVHQNINLDGKGRILDVGCHGSKLVIELASLGYETYGIDVIEYPLKHKNFTFIQGDIYKAPFPDNFFDAVTAVSTIEHVGLGRYGDPTDSDGDKKAVKEIKRILKPDGKAIITVPFGKRTIVYRKEIPLHRVYDSYALTALFSDSGLEIVKIECIAKKGEMYIPVTLSEAENIESGEVVMADALVVAQKEGKA